MTKSLLILPAILLLAAACGEPANQNDSSNMNASTSLQNSNSQNQSQNNNNNQSQTFNTVKVALSSQNNSGQSGTATIIEVNGKAKVILNITGEPTKVVEPAHIHFGSCAEIGAVRYSLTNVGAGASQTTLSVSLQELLSQPFAINVHKSAAEIGVYVACGDSLKMNKSFSNDPAGEAE